MKLGSLKGKGRDGSLIVVDRSLTRYRSAISIVSTLQEALESWDIFSPRLKLIYDELNDDINQGNPLDIALLASPLPRAYQWLDGSAYLSHVERVRKARGADLPPGFLNDPLMYQGGSDIFLGPRDEIQANSEADGIDFESEVAVVVGDVPQGVSADDAEDLVRLVMLVNDVSLRNLIPAELKKGFGFLHGKPPSAFSPVAVTPAELGQYWRDSKLHLPLVTHYNKQKFGEPNAGIDMQFSFAKLIAHAAKTRPLSAGTIIGSGTVSNRDLDTGCSCLAEKRVLEIIAQGEAKTPFMRFGDKVHIEMKNDAGESIFGAIEQEVSTCQS
ncbi:MAG TPA: FAA hydrolase family protein [Gammaproteobacteria bacterium]|nr:FAA hydrolase family protein [Gammaproteobacteria bacterium]